MKLCSKVVGLVVLGLFSGCGEEENMSPFSILSETYDFSESTHGWEPGFAEYPSGPDSALFELQYAYTDQVTQPLLTKKSVMLSGNNLNKDLFMYLRKRITRLSPNTEYTITFNVELASTCNTLTTNASGAVYLKAGAVELEPLSVNVGGYYRINVDKGNDAVSGEHLINLGDIITPETNAGYAVLARNNTMANSRYTARTNENGELWLVIGTDSSLEGKTTLFYTRVAVVLSAS